jgi:hypothetical protein
MSGKGNVINLVDRNPDRFCAVGCLLDGNIIENGEELVCSDDIVLCQECVRRVLIPILKGELARFLAEKDPVAFRLEDASFDKLSSLEVEEVLEKTISQTRSRIEELQDNVSGRYFFETLRLIREILGEENSAIWRLLREQGDC